MTSTQGDPDQAELARSLLALRKTAGMNQVPAAKAAGISQTRLSRAERDHPPRVMLQPDVVQHLCRTYRADRDETARLVLLTTQIVAGFTTARVIYQHGTHHWQERLRLVEARAVEVRSFAPTAIFGTLQTVAYAEAVFSQHGTPDVVRLSVAARRRRHDLLDDPSRRWTLIQTQGAFEWALGGPTVMAEQLDEIAAASLRPNVRLGVIPARTPAPVLPLHGFHLHRRDDGWTVALGSREGTALISDEARVADYLALFAELERLAVFDDDARTLLDRIADDYRRD